MRIVFSDRAIDSLDDAPVAVRRALRKQLGFLSADLRHPSLRAKKYDESRNIWQARVSLHWRFYFRIEDDTYRIEDVILIERLANNPLPYRVQNQLGYAVQVQLLENVRPVCLDGIQT